MHAVTAQHAERAVQVLRDGCGRHIDHLRLSITDRCNLACRYCSTGEGGPSHRLIDIDFAVALVAWISAHHGVQFIRLTGGEPLLHPHLPELIARLDGLGTLREITLTTNAQLLARQALRLRDAGLMRVNISLDTLDPGRFRRLTRGGSLIHTLQGIDAAIDAGLSPIRLNVVVQRGVNDGELFDLASWGLNRACTVRFLEVMPIGPASGSLPDLLVPASEILLELQEHFTLTEVDAPPGQPSTDYLAISRSDGPAGRIGVIASTTRPFCDRCRRIRITSTGEILSCLFDAGGRSLTVAWDGRKLDIPTADSILEAAVLAKPLAGPTSQTRQMLTIGG